MWQRFTELLAARLVATAAAEDRGWWRCCCLPARPSHLAQLVTGNLAHLPCFPPTFILPPLQVSGLA
jgi:hypothetical protein